MKLSIALLAFALVAVAVPATAWPDCTCDPNPATDLVRCLINGDACPTVPTLPQPAPAPSPRDLVEQLDPRNWPCTCDPMPQPLDVGHLLA